MKRILAATVIALSLTGYSTTPAQACLVDTFNEARSHLWGSRILAGGVASKMCFYRWLFY